ncbi:MAG: hypothetical protein EBR82_02835 [Caulobacteraceae bacterium]|nr:hypothetical protein [Caulobacteraceae bacterium]
MTLGEGAGFVALGLSVANTGWIVWRAWRNRPSAVAARMWRAILADDAAAEARFAARIKALGSRPVGSGEGGI